MGLNLGYMLMQMIAILLLPIGVYRYARLWVGERAASYAGVGGVFIGSLSFLVYDAGQPSTTVAAPLYLNALPYFYEWSREGRWRSLLKGIVLIMAAAAAHHVTLIFIGVFFVLPLFALAIKDRKRDGVNASTGAVVARAAIFALLALAAIAAVLLPYWIAIYHHSINQSPIPHPTHVHSLSPKQYRLTHVT